MPTTLRLAVTRLSATAPDPRTDARLVADFLRTADQHAFAELVRRHGPAVLGVCTRALGHTPDAEDAFQATFLVLVRRARATDWREALGPWLYGVALRVARKARARRARRRAHETQAHAMSAPSAPQPAQPDDTAAVVDEELAALPARLREPLILCAIQGRSRHAAARELGLTEGTLSSRLARGRKLLRARLAHRGLAPVAAGAVISVPAPLAAATVQNATHMLTHAAGAVPAGVLALTEGVVKTMLTKWKLAVVLIASCVGITGVGTWRESPAQATPVAALPFVPVSKTPTENNPTTAPPKNEVPRVKVVAIVGANNVVTDQEVWESVRQQNEEPSRRKGNATKPTEKERYAAALRKTIERELILDEMYEKLKKANKASVIEELKDVATRSAEKRIQAMKDRTGAKTDDDWNEWLRARGLTLPVLRRQFERQFMAEQYAHTMIGEVCRHIGATEAREYYDAHPEEFRTSDRARWQHVFISNGNPPNPRAALARVEAIRRQAETQEFSTLVKQFDEGPAGRAGVFGAGIAKGLLAPDIEAAIWKLKPGEMSAPIPTPAGYHLVKVIERDYAGTVPFDTKTRARILDKLNGAIRDAETMKLIEGLWRKGTVRVLDEQSAAMSFGP